MTRTTALRIDAAINLALGVLLLAFSPGLADFLGVPPSDTRFYPTILGAVFVGIAVALALESRRPVDSDAVGLGLVGAACINLCGGLVLGLWLVLGHLALPMRGLVLLWSLVAVLVVLSGAELLRARRSRAS
jgi:hypothetical protein